MALPPLGILQILLVLPVIAGSAYTLATLGALLRFRTLARRPQDETRDLPPVSVLKPVHGLEKDLLDNLRGICQQDYPDYQVVVSVEDANDPALPLLRQLAAEFGAERVTIVIQGGSKLPNGKVRNLLGSLSGARHEVLVISDSDVRAPRDYLRRIVSPLADPGVGCVCTFYRATGAATLREGLEQLTLNTDFVPNLIFAWVTGAAAFCLGASTALTRSRLEEIGGMAALGDYLVEDFEMGRRLRERGHRVVILPAFVDTMVDLKTVADWWHHQVYWDQNTRAANPVGHFGTLFIRAVPFALAFAGFRGFDPLGLLVLGGALALRGIAAACFLLALGDRAGLRFLWLLPFRDLAGMVSAVLSFTRPRVVWRGARLDLSGRGRLQTAATGDSHQETAPRHEPAA